MTSVNVIGMACRLPGADCYDLFWRNLLEAKDQIKEIPAERWDNGRYYSSDPAKDGVTNSRWGGLIDRVDLFDHHFFGLSAREARSMDPQQRILLEETWHCLEDAGLPHAELRARVTAVYVSAMTIDYHQNVTAPHVAPDSYACLGNYVGILANRISNQFGWRGESYALDAACAGSLTALHQARRALLAGECDYALVAGVSLIINPWHYVSFGKSRMLSPDGRCRTFDRDANGYVPGEGVAVLLLCREDDANLAGRRSHARVLGTATGHVGSSGSITAPSIAAQRRVIEDAAVAAGIGLDTVSYVEVHGTGTPLGDPIEVAALNAAFAQYGPRETPCRIGSVKTNIGHLEAAAGLAGVIKVLLMMRYRFVVPSLNLVHLNPLIDFSKGLLRPVTAGEPWTEAIPRAGVSAFGFGGTNAHAILEAVEVPQAAGEECPVTLPFLLSAQSPTSFRALWLAWRTFVATPDFAALSLGDILETLAAGRAALDYRWATTGIADKSDLARVFAEEPPEPHHVQCEPRLLLRRGSGSSEIAEARMALLRRLGVRPVAIAVNDAETMPASGHADRDRSVAQYDALTGLMRLPWALDEIYLAALHEDLTLPEKAIFDSLIRRSQDLLLSNFTFRAYLEDWQRGVGSRGDLFSWVAEPPVSAADRKLLWLCLVAANRRLMEKWHLPNAGDCVGEAWQELAALITDGLLREEEAIAFLGGSKIDRSRLAPIVAARALAAIKPLAYPVLSRHSASRMGVVEMETPPADFSIGIAEGEEREFLAALWLAGLDLDWRVLGVPQRVVALPLYPFDGHRHWIDLHPGPAALSSPLEAAVALPPPAAVRTPENPLVSCPRSSSSFATHGEDKQATDYKEKVSRFRPHSNALDCGIGTRDGLDAFAAQRLFIGLDRAGALTPLGIGMTRATIARRCLRLPKHRTFLDAAITILERHGLVACTGDWVRALRDRREAAAVASTLRAAIAADGTESLATAMTVERCLAALPDILAGEIPAEDIVFPGGDPGMVERLLWGHDEARECLALTVDAVVRASAGSGRDVRVLEIGAGTGLGSVAILAGLARLGGVIDYLCTDRATSLLAAARERLKAASMTPRFAVLDIGSPASAPEALGRFDVIVAVNALHALARIGEGLAHLRGLLRPGGVLILNEPTCARDTLTLTLGLLSDWWRDDPARTEPGALLSAERWRDVLRSGFVDIQLAGATQTRSVIMARSPQRPQLSAPSITAASEADGALLAIVRGAVADSIRSDPATLPDDARFADIGLDSLAAGDLARLLGTSLGQTIPLHVIDDHPSIARLARHLAGENRDAVALAIKPSVPVVKSSATAADAGGTDFLAKVRELVAQVTDSDSASITDDARFADIGVDSLAAGDLARLLGQAIGTTVALHVIDDHPTVTRLAHYLADHLQAPAPERAVAVASPPVAGAVQEKTQIWQVTEAGNLDSLALIERIRREPARGEVAVEVVAAGLNFRDVMEGLGRIGDQQRPLGLEFAGRVTAIGTGVSGFFIGQPVVGVAIGCLARHVVLPASCLAPKPPVLSFAQAAALPIVFLTATWTLEEIAHLTRSQTVLVHAASGGVGLAALQIAQRVGATFLATAGNHEKRAYLHSLGVACVGDSRSLSFVDDVRAATGGAGVDVVLNCLAGAMTDAGLDLVRPGGLFIELGKTDIRGEDAVVARHPGIRYKVFDLLAEIDRDPDGVARRLAVLVPRFTAGEVSALPVRGFPFAEAPSALRFLARARHVGKVVLTDEPMAVAPVAASTPRPKQPAEAIAIVGMAGRFPGAPDLDAFWDLMREGRDAIGHVPDGRWSERDFAGNGAAGGGEARHRAGGFLAGAENFDAGFFGISPREALLLDPQQRLLLEQTWLALTDAGLRTVGQSALRIGVFIGASASDYGQKAVSLGLPPDRPSLLAQMPSSLAARLGYVFDLKGPSLTVDMGCASAVAALKLATDALRRGEIDAAVVGAAAVQSTPQLALMADQADILAPDGRCRSFAASAQGLGLSEGAAVMVLKCLQGAEAAGDAIHAVIRGVAVSQNGATNGMSAPSVAAQIALARGAMAEAGVVPDSISYIEGHGVGTKAGDAAEVAALVEVFGRRRVLPLGSVKSNIGHTLAVAGMAGLFKVVLQLQHGLIAPSLHAEAGTVEELNGTGLSVVSRPTRWVAAAGAPRRAAINAFAINGANGFVLVEEAPPRPARSSTPASALILFAAGTEAALRARLVAVATWLEDHAPDLADLAHSLNTATANALSAGPLWRAAFVAVDGADLGRQLRDAAPGPLAKVGRGESATRVVFADMAERLCAEAASSSPAERAAKLAAVGQLFVDGVDVVPPIVPGARPVVGLPGYRFDPQRFWLGDAAPAAAVVAEAACPVEDSRLKILREAAAAVLRLPVMAVSGASVLTRLGLDSLLAFDLRSRLARSFGVTVEPATLLSARSIAQIAQALPAAAASCAAALHSDPASRFAPFPLTDIQLAYWLGRRPDFALGGACHVYWEFLGAADRDPVRLERAFNRLIGVHDMLRAVVNPDGLQRVLPTVPPYRIERYDARDLATLRAEMAQEIFDPSIWPLFRVGFSRDGSCTRLHLSIDLLIIDVPSLALLLDQWAKLEREPELALAAPGLTFRDYVLHQKAQEQGAPYQEARAYWLAELPKLPGAPRLPDMKPFDARSNWSWQRHRGVLHPPEWQAFQARSRAAGATPVAALVTAFAEALGHWAEEKRFTLNLTVNDREPLHPDVSGVIGDFTSTLLLGLDLSAPEGFGRRARGTGGDIARHLGHARFPGVKTLQQREAMGEAALMPVVFTSMLGYGALSGPLGRIDFGATQTPQVWLDAQVMEEDGALIVTWDAIDGLFPDGLLGGIFAGWMAGLQALATDAALWDRPLGLWLEETELTRRAARNATDDPMGEELLHEAFLAQALAAPDRLAVVGPDGQVSYGALLGQALAVAEALGPVAPDHLVAVAMPKGWRQIAAVLGVLLTGGAYLPIDPSLPPARQRHLLARSEASAVLTLDGLGMEWRESVHVVVVDRLSPAPLPSVMPPRRATPGDLAYVIFTSGSTGEPKGVMIEHRAALNTVLDVNARFGVGPNDRVLGLSSLSFDLSVYDIFGVLGAGGAVVLPDSRSANDPAHLADLIRAHRVTLWNSVPMFMQLFLAGEQAGEALRSIRLVMMSGDWVPLGLPARLRAANPAVQITSLGGATEAAIWSIAYEVIAQDPSWSSIPYGYPMRNQRFHVLDEAMRPRPDWVAGELYIAGAGLARGYWRDAATTAARFVVHPVTGERLYRTGDLGRYREDGVIEFLGRRDGQVKLGGHRIELGEIETALARHPAVQHAAVVIRTDQNGHQALTAFYVSDAAIAPDAAALRAHLAALLPSYMLPGSFHRLEALPLNANEKVDRNALAAGAGDTPVTPKPMMPSAPPKIDGAALEQSILAIWREVLNNPLLPADGKLFENGAHSFHAVDANTRINRALGIGCTVTDIFEFATVRALSAALAARRGGVSQSLPEPLPAPVSLPLTTRGERRRRFRAMTAA